MATYHVGGFNPIRRTKTLSEAAEKASYDDVIELHKNINETIIIDKPLQIKGNGYKWTVESGSMGLKITQPTILEDIQFEVSSRANGIVAEANVVFTNIKAKLIGPIVAFYPVVWLKSGKHKFTDCTLTKVYASDTSSVTLNNSTIYSYYGENIETSERDETSVFEGTTIVNNGSVGSTTFYDVTLNNTDVRKFVRIHDGNLNNINLTTKQPDKLDKLQVSGRGLKKEPNHGPLATQTNNDYHIYMSGKVDINNYTVYGKSETLGFYGSTSHINAVNINNQQENIIHKLVKSSISFKDSTDNNFWSVDDTTLQQVRSHINTNSTEKTAMEQLDELIGLDNVKQQLRSLLNSIKMGSNHGFSNHVIFAGDPGTGKSSVGKVYAKALFEVGAIPENKVTFATNDTLVKGYIGQTGENVARILDDALGGVLFIDEAYQLTVKEGEKTFNDEVISVLIRYMEDHRDNLVVIAAGYSKEMRQFLASNSGLSRRFQWIEFDDYTSDEMVQIFELMRKQNDDQYSSDVDPRIIKALFAKLVELNLSRPDANGRITNGGNGGLVRNVYQRITQAKNDRFVTYGGELTITKADIVKGFEVEMKQTLQKTM